MIAALVAALSAIAPLCCWTLLRKPSMHERVYAPALVADTPDMTFDCGGLT